MKKFGLFLITVLISHSVVSPVSAQEVYPVDNGIATYHTAPRYRDSESHPLRIVAYIVHPIGWVLREAIFRPLSYFASSTETRRSVMGYREPFDYRQPECFSADDSSPDCRTFPPYNYDGAPAGETFTEDGRLSGTGGREVFFPNVNFDFDSRSLNQLGLGKSQQLAAMLKADSAPMKVVLQGHTDYLGSDEYNMKLGMDRAEAVKHQLISLGVSKDRLSTVSFGESKPMFDEQTDWARAMNRRVETLPDMVQ